MKLTEVLPVLQGLDRQGIYIFDRSDMGLIFSADKDKALEKTLQRLVGAGVLERVCRGIYLNPFATSKGAFVIEDIAAVLRRGYYSYISLESMLSEYGAISQIPISRLTVMTTGPKGLYQTKYGTIEFTHTQRSWAEIDKRVILDPRRPLRVATQEGAKRDLIRVGRNVSMLEIDLN